MFWDVLETFRNVIERYGLCRARLYVDGLATQVIVNYLPSDEMEIIRLPSDLPPYLRFDDDGIYLDPEKKLPVTEEEEYGFCELYRTWDPRIIARAEPEESIGPVEGRWRLRYYLHKAIPIKAKIEQRIQTSIEQPMEAEFVVFRGRLRELNEHDFSTYSTQLALAFEYPDGQ